MQPDKEELGKGDDIKVLKFVDRGDEKPPTSKTYKKYKAMVSSMGSREKLTTQNKVNNFQIDLGNGAEMICLSANGFVKNRGSKVANVNTENERSIAFLVKYGGFDYFMGGDTIGRKYGSENAEVEKAIGEYLVNNDISIDVLHVNHHGGNNGSELEFLNSIEAEVAIISLGNDNSHHHPNSEVLQRLVESGVYRIYQTEWGTSRGETPHAVRRRQAIFQGDVILTTDGQTYSISTNRSFDVDD